MWSRSKAKRDREDSERKHSAVSQLIGNNALTSKAKAPPSSESSCLVCQGIAKAVTNWPIDSNDHQMVVSLDDWEGFLRRVDCETCQ